MTETQTVIFVDDDPTLLDSLRRAHHKWAGGWSPVFVESAAAALAVLQQRSCAAVVTDLAMPGKSGYELIVHINEHWPQIPCLMLSGTADMADAMNLINTATIFRFFVKPTAAHVLFAAVDEAVLTWQATQQPDTDVKASLAALNQLAAPIMVVDAESLLLHGNQAAMAALKARTLLHLDHAGHVRTQQSAQTQKLHTTVKTVAEHQTDSLSIAMAGPNQDHPIVLNISHLEQQGAMLMMIDPQQQTPPSLDVLKMAYDLTPSEARLAQRLALGLSLEEAAEQAGVTLETARTYLKRIFRKTQTTRQPELVRLLVLNARQ